LQDRPQSEDFAGGRIGPYKILRSLGLGGMGEVYLAERADEHFTQRVAIKVVRGGALTRGVQSRLKVERQILAQLDHPNIAHLIDGGELADGGAYIVMEYVDGVPIDQYCDDEKLDVPARLRLFQTVCSAVHAAHQNLIVHRDLKPSNILVTAGGVPKLLDFGIAKLLDDRLAMQQTVAVTHADIRVMTPDHASPEQVRGQPITTASDVYVLGVVLYELLTGCKPFAIPSMRLADIERIICEQEPARPSETFADEQSEEVRAVAKNRGGTPIRIRKALESDIDNIVLMAMRKEPQRRYASAQQLASDIQRHLDDMPVIARKDTFSYRASKFLRRNWIGASAGASLFAVVTVFAIVTYVQSLHIAAERDQVAKQRANAERERQRAEEVSEFLINLFKLSDPEENHGNQVTARELLNSGAQRLRTVLTDQPATRAALLATVGAVYNSLGLYKDALPVLDESLALQRDSHDRVHLGALLSQGRARLGASELVGAESSLQSALRIAQADFGAGSLETARTIWELGDLRREQGRFADAEGLYKRCLTIFETNHASPTDVSWLLDDLGIVYEREQQWALAKVTYERALEIDQRLLGDDHPRVAVHLHNLAIVNENLGDLKSAEDLFVESIRRYEHVYGLHHPETARAWSNYGQFLQREGRLAAAEPYLRRALAVTLSLFGAKHSLVAYNRVSLAILLHEKGDLASAEGEFRQALAVYDKTLPADHQWRASALMHLARLLIDRGRPAEALELSRESIRIWTTTSNAASPKTAQAHAIHGYAQLKLGKTAPAVEEIASALAVLTQAPGANDAFVQRTSKWLAEARSKRG